MMKATHGAALVLMVTALILGGCKREADPKKAAPEPAATPPAAAAQAGAAADKPAPQGEAMAGGHGISGTVLETFDSGGYTYVKLKTKGGDEAWAAVRQTKVAEGQELTIARAMPMKNFHSKTLDRTFETIYFGSLGGDKAGGMGKGGMGMGKDVHGGGQGMGHKRPAAAVVDIGEPLEAVEGPGGHAVGQIYAKKADLSGKEVAVRGKVVKVNMNIMGRNWLHLQDGSGSAAQGTHDLTVTTKESAKVGDVVVARGVIAVNRDFGSGYSYPVLLEQAKLTPEQTAKP